MVNTDLQVHSFFSDAVEDPEELLRQAADKKLIDFAITDHSSLIAYSPRLFDLARELKITLRPGIEIEVSRDVDVLVYNTNLENNFEKFKSDVNSIISTDINARISKAEKTINDIKNFLQNGNNQPSWLLWKDKTNKEKEELLNFFTLENAQRISFKSGKIDDKNKREYVGKPHIAFLLQNFNLIDWGKFAAEYNITDKGKLIKKSYKVLFEEISHWPGDQSDLAIGNAVSNLNYIKILAHPGKTYLSLNSEYKEEAFKKFVLEQIEKYNLNGAECFYMNYDEQEIDFNVITTRILNDLTKDRNSTYYGTGGTDTHGKLK